MARTPSPQLCSARSKLRRFYGYQKEKKKPFDVSLLGQLPYAPGMIEPMQGVNPSMGVSNRNMDFPLWVGDIRHLTTVPVGYPPPFVQLWLEEVTEPIREEYRKSIFSVNDPADHRMGLLFAAGINLVGLGVSRINPAAGGLILAIPDVFVAYPVGVAASNIYQSLEGDTPSDKAFRFWLPKSLRNMPF